MHILIVSKSNLKLQVFGLFLRFVRTLILNISSSEEPANSTSIHRVRNGGKLVIIFIPLQKICRKGVDRQLKTHGSALKIPKWRRKRRTNFIGTYADVYAPALPMLCFKAQHWILLCNWRQITAS